MVIHTSMTIGRCWLCGSTDRISRDAAGGWLLLFLLTKRKSGLSSGVHVADPNVPWSVVSKIKWMFHSSLQLTKVSYTSFSLHFQITWWVLKFPTEPEGWLYPWNTCRGLGQPEDMFTMRTPWIFYIRWCFLSYFVYRLLRSRCVDMWLLAFHTQKFVVF